MSIKAYYNNKCAVDITVNQAPALIVMIQERIQGFERFPSLQVEYRQQGHVWE